MTNDRLRRIVLTHVADETQGALYSELEEAAKDAPSRSDWSLYDHCAALTRLYAIFENFVDEAVKEYLEHLPRLFPSYATLPQSIQTQHRLGVAALLSKLGDKGLNSHLTEALIIDGIAKGNSGYSYRLLPEAFLTGTQNYRPDQVKLVFSYLDFADIWDGASKHQAVTAYMKIKEEGKTASGILIQLVKDRNMAAHSEIETVYAAPILISLADYFEAVITAISELLIKRLVELDIRAGHRKQIGRVVHVYSNAVVGIEFKQGELRLGDSLIAVGANGAKKITVMSIRKLAQELVVADSRHYGELGVGFDQPLRTADRIVTSEISLVSLTEEEPTTVPLPLRRHRSLRHTVLQAVLYVWALIR